MEYIFEYINIVKNFIFSNINYKIIFLIMTFESTIIPPIIPTELFLIFLGYSISTQQNISLIGSILVSTLGIIVGSFISYLLGYYLKKEKILKILKYLKVKEGKFNKYEEKLKQNWKLFLFLFRWVPIPGIKHIVAIPCGILKVNFKIFTVISSAGGILLSSIYIVMGFKLGLKESKILLQNLKLLTLLALVIFVLNFIYKNKVNKHL